MRYLITPSLLNSFLYYMKSDDSWEEKAKSDFWSSLKRSETKKTESMIAGIEFEELVNGVADLIESGELLEIDGRNKYLKCINDCANMVAFGCRQVKVSSNISIDGVDFFLYGIVDVLKGDSAYDIKFTTSSYEMGKYRKTSQGPCYLECLEGVNKFIYLVSDGAYLYTEVYRRTDLPKAEHLIREFWQTISAVPEMLDTYTSLWKARDENVTEKEKA